MFWSGVYLAITTAVVPVQGNAEVMHERPLRPVSIEHSVRKIVRSQKKERIEGVASHLKSCQSEGVSGTFQDNSNAIEMHFLASKLLKKQKIENLILNGSGVSANISAGPCRIHKSDPDFEISNQRIFIMNFRDSGNSSHFRAGDVGLLEFFPDLSGDFNTAFAEESSSAKSMQLSKSVLSILDIQKIHLSCTDDGIPLLFSKELPHLNPLSAAAEIFYGEKLYASSSYSYPYHHQYYSENSIELHPEMSSGSTEFQSLKSAS